MFSRLMLVFLACFTSVSTTPMVIYNNARFDPIDVRFQLSNLFSITTQNECECQCYANSSCITGNFFGINQTCVLFSASIAQGQLRLIINSLASVFSFPNRIIITDVENPPMTIVWLFDGNLQDLSGVYNGQMINNNGIVWISPGYAGYGSAVQFSNGSYSFVNYSLDLSSTSFTISAWIMLPFNDTVSSYSFVLFAHCDTSIQDKCLHLTIQKGYLYFGFYWDDLTGSIEFVSNQWYHVAYVYNRSSPLQLLYVNGKADNIRTPSGSYKGNASRMTMGSLFALSWATFRNGYIDKLTFVSCVKNDSELLEEATLVAYYPFDNSFLDSGPNQINNTSGASTTFDSSGRINQCLLINSINPAYFQATGFYYLGQSNYPYSFSLWIYPFVNNGTILQVQSPNGWCVPMIGYNSAGSLTVQTLYGIGVYKTSLNSTMLSLNEWTHVTMTYSTTNGLRLFVNGTLVSSNAVQNNYSASGQINTIIVGTCLSPTTCAVNQTQIVPSQFRGKIDELKIFSRELSTSEVSQLALA